MTGQMDGQVCLISGATGIAAAAARRCAAAGAKVFVMSLHAQECTALAGELEAAGGTCGWSAGDLSDESVAVGAVASAVARFGRIDGLFAVAGASGRRFGDGPLHDMPVAGWEETLRINGLPAFLAARETIRQLLGQDRRADGTRGSVVLMSSVLASSPSAPLFATHAYAAVKGALLSLTRASAASYAAEGIRVNAVAPGLVATPMAARAAHDARTVAFAERKQPLARGFLPADDVAAAGVFLLSADARYITGQTLTVDGGWSVTDALA